MAEIETENVFEILERAKREGRKVEDEIYDSYYAFIRNFGYIPFEEFLKIPRRHLYEIMRRLEQEMREYNKVR